jgi:hypothetical protein
MKRHLSAAALARFREGDLSQRRAARVSAHLSRCARCTDLSAELAGITTLLASTPAPPMPDRLATRIQDTLAAEAARRVALDPGTEPGRRDLPGRGRPPRRRLPVLSSPVAVRALAAAGATAVLAGGGYLVFSQNAASNSARGTAASRAAAGTGAGEHHAGLNHVMGQPAMIHLHRHHGQASIVPVASGVNYQPATLTAQVTAALSQAKSAATARNRSQLGTMTVSALQGCLDRIAPRGRVLLVDVARYRGREATVIVVAPEAAAPRQVWVVGPACSASSSDVLAARSLPGS